jgi:hypothetical protein
MWISSYDWSFPEGRSGRGCTYMSPTLFRGPKDFASPIQWKTLGKNYRITALALDIRGQVYGA